MLDEFLGRMRAAGYPGAEWRSVRAGFLRKTRARCWEGWLTIDGQMFGIPLGLAGREQEVVLTPADKWIAGRIRDIHHRAVGSTRASTTPVERQLADLASTLDRILAANGIEV